MPEPKEIERYHILVYGGPEGYQDTRAEIALYDKNNNVVGFIRFIDSGMKFEKDYISMDIIRMHLPSNMFINVIDILRNEKPIYIHFTANRGFLTTSKEPVGEEEE